MWLLVSTNPDNLNRFFRSCRETSLGTPGRVLVNGDVYLAQKEAFEKIPLPERWEFRLTQASTFVVQIQELWDEVRNMPWVGVLGDDCIPLSSKWDGDILHSVAGWNVVSTYDDLKSGPGGIDRGSIWSGDLLRLTGFLFLDGLSEQEQYLLWQEIGRTSACWTHRGDIFMRHFGAVDRSEELTEAIQSWLTENLPGLAHRIDEEKSGKGILKFTVDYEGVNIMVAVPAWSGELPHEFINSLHETFAMFMAANVRHEFAVEASNADIVMARSKIFARFMRSKCTHLLMVDDDMIWSPADVGRLFAAKADFAAVAGPKKKIPLQCAVQPIAIDENYGTVKFEPETGSVEVSEVGAAFVLLTRNLGEKMIEAYPELAYNGIGGEIEHALFLPMIVKKVYKAEDYALCNRWRAIGGKIAVCPDISLGHIGKYTYKGAWAETWPRDTAQVKEAAE